MFKQTATEFEQAHLEFYHGLARYIWRGSNRLKEANRRVIPWLLEENGSQMLYNNVYTRIAVCRQTARLVYRALKGAEGDLFMLSTAPECFGEDSQVKLVYPEELSAWLAKRLRGLNYLGVIEGAWYGNYYKDIFPRTRVSWHFHVITWGAERSTLRAIKQDIIGREDCFIRGQASAHYMVISKANLRSRVRYVLKAPMKEYRLINRPREDLAELLDIDLRDSREGSNWADLRDAKPGNTKKQELGRGAMIKLLNMIGDQPIASFIVAGGEGESIKIQALERAYTELVAREADMVRGHRRFLSEAANSVCGS